MVTYTFKKSLNLKKAFHECKVNAQWALRYRGIIITMQSFSVHLIPFLTIINSFIMKNQYVLDSLKVYGRLVRGVV